MYFCAAQLQELQAQLSTGDQEMSCMQAHTGPSSEDNSQEEAAVRIYFGYRASSAAAAAPTTGTDGGGQHSDSEQISEAPCPPSQTCSHAHAHTSPPPVKSLLQSAHAQKQALAPSCCDHAQQQQQQQQQGVGLGSCVFEDSLWPRFCCAKDQLQRLEAALLASRKVERRSHQMYVVREGETADTICAALSLPVEALEAANPDVPVRCVDGGLQCNDCIVLPVPVCLPRLYVTKPGDSGLMKIASACGVKSQCLRAANLELLASWGMRVFTEPGWVLSLPGLKGYED